MTRPDDELAPGDHDDELAPGDRLEPDERDPQAPEADAAEQAATVGPAATRDEVRRGWEVGEWDAAEQAVVIDLDEDDYR